MEGPSTLTHDSSFVDGPDPNYFDSVYAIDELQKEMMDFGLPVDQSSAQASNESLSMTLANTTLESPLDVEASMSRSSSDSLADNSLPSVSIDSINLPTDKKEVC